MTWELLDKPGQAPKAFSVTGDQAIALLEQAVQAAKTAGLPWPTEPMLLEPSAELVELVRLSQLEATKEDAVETK
jgi:CRISPR-associated protein Csb1